MLVLFSVYFSITAFLIGATFSYVSEEKHAWTRVILLQQLNNGRTGIHPEFKKDSRQKENKKIFVQKRILYLRQNGIYYKKIR